MATSSRRPPKLFSDVDGLIRELRALARIVGAEIEVDPEKVAMLKDGTPLGRRKGTRRATVAPGRAPTKAARSRRRAARSARSSTSPSA